MTSIDVHDLTKDYGGTRAVDGVSFRVLPGRVTGFLGPNGAGKSTTLRIVLGLDRPTSGSATLGGRPYRSLGEPLRHAGALLDAAAAHGGRTARDHLLTLAHSNRIPAARVAVVLAEAGLKASHGGGSGPSPWACGSGWASRRRCSAIRACSSSTNRPTDSIRRASSGSAA